jgi:hypothetical protein
MPTFDNNVIPAKTGIHKDNNLDSRSSDLAQDRFRGNDKASNNDIRSCSICRKLRIVPGKVSDYKELAPYHYRNGQMGPFVAIFALRAYSALAARLGRTAIGVIVYTMPTPGLELRNTATGNLFVGLDRSTQLASLNKNIRRISRVIIEPRFRGLGLASRLVRQTMPQMNVPIIEAMAVMGLANPFFEKAGMKAFTAAMPARCVQLTEALSMVGIEERELIDIQTVQGKLDRLPKAQADFIELQIAQFLQSYGKRRNMSQGPERTRFVLSKLTARPVYYIWFNPELDTRSRMLDTPRESSTENRV